MRMIFALIIAVNLPLYAAVDSIGSTKTNYSIYSFLLQDTAEMQVTASRAATSQRLELVRGMKVIPPTSWILIKPERKFTLVPSSDLNMMGLENFQINQVFHMERFRTPALRIRI